MNTKALLAATALTLIALGLFVTACSTTGGDSANVSPASTECSKQAFNELRQEIRLAQEAYGPIGAVADRDPSESNTAAAAAAAADVAIAQANLAAAQADCAEQR